jgi:hypothetical protein
MRPFLVAGLLVALSGTHSAAQEQRPLDTQDPETLGTGRALAQLGVGTSSGVAYPLSGLTGNLWQLPVFGFSIGVGPIADLQITGGPYDYLQITRRMPAPFTYLMTDPDADSTHDVDDVVVATKIRWASESAHRPAIGMRLSVRLPNSKHHSGLGQDTTDFSASLLAGKTLARWRVVGNIGATIMTEPINSTSQNDVLTYGVSLARPVVSWMELVGEVNGRVSTRRGVAPPGTESRGIARGGVRLGRGGVRFDVAGGAGLTDVDPAFTATAGVTFLFKAFDAP